MGMHVFGFDVLLKSLPNGFTNLHSNQQCENTLSAPYLHDYLPYISVFSFWLFWKVCVIYISKIIKNQGILGTLGISISSEGIHKRKENIKLIQAQEGTKDEF